MGFKLVIPPSCPYLLCRINSLPQWISCDNNEYSLEIFLDLAKGFDTIDHSILFKKLIIYGIRNVQLNWFRSYLENRMQLVSCNGARSPLKPIEYGGSILGPLLFILFINDLPNVSSTLFFILFADDTNIFYSDS